MDNIKEDNNLQPEERLALLRCKMDEMMSSEESYLMDGFMKMVYGDKNYAGPYHSYSSEKLVHAVDVLNDMVLIKMPCEEDFQNFLDFWVRNFRGDMRLIEALQERWERVPFILQLQMFYIDYLEENFWTEEYLGLNADKKRYIDATIDYFLLFEDEFTVFISLNDREDEMYDISKAMLHEEAVIRDVFQGILTKLLKLGGVMTLMYQFGPNQNVISSIYSTQERFIALSALEMQVNAKALPGGCFVSPDELYIQADVSY